MKKLLIAAAAMLLSTGVFAQPDYGVKAGLNLGNITNSDAGFKPSVYIGVFAEFPIHDIIGFQPELQYSRQGNYDSGGGTKVWIRNNYLNLPLMFKFYAIDKLSVDVGPQLGVMLNSKSKVKAGGTSVTVKNKDIGADPNTFDLSVGFGLSYKLYGPVDVSLRYNLGLTKVFDSDEKNRNSVIQIGAGYRF